MQEFVVVGQLSQVVPVWLMFATPSLRRIITWTEPARPCAARSFWPVRIPPAILVPPLAVILSIAAFAAVKLLVKL